jgi:hypothetical protein
MAISPTELRSWTTPGAQEAAQRTYAAVRAALEQSPKLKAVSYEPFLQGSYANSTNTRGDSDVDIVAMLLSTYYDDTTNLSPIERQSYDQATGLGTVSSAQFRGMVQDALEQYFGAARVMPKDKCIRVAKKDGYVDADVVPALQYRLYKAYSAYNTEDYIEGIAIDPLSGGRIINYPKEHLKNGSGKNSLCSQKYKPTVRQVKRLRRRAVDLGLLDKKVAPGYLLECMVYNAPNSLFLYDDVARVASVLGWLSSQSAEQMAATFKSCDEIHHLFVDDPGEHNQYTAERVIKQLWDLL